MSNPISDWLNKVLKPATDPVLGKAGVGTSSSSSTTATGRAGVGVSSDLQSQRDAIAKKTNQQVINAAYKVADQLQLKGGPWPLLRAAGWGRLTENRGAMYKGKAIDEIDKLTPEQKAALKSNLGL